MSLSPRRLLPSVLALAAVALLGAGCASNPATPGAEGTKPAESAAPAPADKNDVDVAWLDEGRAIAIVTMGSSTCQPHVDDITADGQTLNVTLVDPDQKACSKDFVARAAMAMLPEGFDVTKDVELAITYGEQSFDADLDALAAAPEGSSQQQPSAGWFNDRGIALLTWGSSSCQPAVEDVEMTDAGATVTFTAPAADRACTMDMAPRVTVIELPEEPANDDSFTLTLTGDNLDGQVPVMD